MAARKKSARRKRRLSRKRAVNVRPDRVSSSAVEMALAGIAHDIRTPLTGIVALAELLVSSDLPAREREWAGAIRSGADHLSALTTLIIDAVKSDAGRLVLRHEPFSPRALADSVAAALAGRASNKGIKAEISIAPDLPAMVAGDPVRLRAALENLADNAVKFTSEGVVRFSATAEKPAHGHVRLVFEFVDDGIGISASEMKQLFRPFAQGSAEVAKSFGGSGLGLSFVRRLAKAMGGKLDVSSKKKGNGSTFRLSILAHAVEEVAPSANRTDMRPQSARPLNLLCAEDNPYGRVVMNTILRELGHRVDFVETAEAALTAIGRGSYDAVLLDVTLPGVDGIEAARRIRALRGKAGRTPIIGISGRATGADEKAARAAGMNHYFMKPVSPRKLAQALAVV